MTVTSLVLIFLHFHPEPKTEFETSIRTYEEVCNERGIAPSKPFRGDFMARMINDNYFCRSNGTCCLRITS